MSVLPAISIWMRTRAMGVSMLVVRAEWRSVTVWTMIVMEWWMSSLTSVIPVMAQTRISVKMVSLSVMSMAQKSVLLRVRPIYLIFAMVRTMTVIQVHQTVLMICWDLMRVVVVIPHRTYVIPMDRDICVNAIPTVKGS